MDHYLSSKPEVTHRYENIYDKVVAYERLIGGAARSLDRTANARTHAKAMIANDDSPFAIPDSASARYRIGGVNRKLKGRVAIIGLGGTGSFLLDLLAKTWVTEIHLYDGDQLLNHNLFRSPGSPEPELLKGFPYKVDYYAQVYARMHTGITAHPVRVTAATHGQGDHEAHDGAPGCAHPEPSAGYANKTDYALTAFPFYRDPDNTWAVRGETNNGPGNNGNRWAVDDLPSDLATSTIHRVWVRQANPGVVVNTDNSGPGSLRDAVVFANGRATSTTISFAIPGAGPHIITLTAALPNLTANGLTIDGSTQPGAQCRDLWAGGGHDLRVHLRGPGVLGPVLLGTGQRIRGLAITEFSNGVTLGSASTLASVQCSYVGLRPDGSAPGVTDRAIRALGVSGRIGGLNPGEGNVISGVSIGVITETGSTDTSIQGNFIGTDPTGMAARPNTFRGINSLAGAATWRDITGNLISGNAGPGGIALEGDDRVTASTDTIRIQRNRIGFNRTLSALLANNGDGINFGASSITNVLIGGTDTSDGNEISGSSDGIDLNTVSNIRIRGNTIARATANGIMLVGSSNITIGGTGTGEGNRIGGNTTNGIAVLDGSSNVSVLGNLIQPLTIEGTTAGNADHGIAITGANNVSIGDGTADHQSHLLLSRGASFQPFR